MAQYFKKVSFKQLAAVSGLYGGFSYFYQRQSAYEIICQQTDINKQVLEYCQSLIHFKPTVYLLSGFLQAYFGAKDTYFDENVQYITKEIDIPVKGKFSVQWAYNKNDYSENQKPTVDSLQQNSNKLIVLVPGVTASSDEPYIINMISECLKQGYNVVLYNDRLYNKNSPKFHLNENQYYCYLDDLSNVMKNIFETTNYDEYFAIGHSLGANTLVKYLGSSQTEKFKAVVSVANPWDLNVVVDNLVGIFDQYILQSRQHFLLEKKDQILEHFQKINKNNIDIEECLQAKTSKDYDHCFTRKIHGNYKQVSDYFKFMNSANAVRDVKIPLLCLQSIDDPICHYESIPKEQCLKNDKVLMWVSQTGGHVGWYQGFFKPKRWYMQPTLEFLNFHSKIDTKNILKSINA